MENPAGESVDGSLRLDFDRRLTLQFRGSVVTSDAGLLAYRELDDAFGPSVMVGGTLADARTGRNGRPAVTHAHAGDARANQGLITIKLEGKADQNRSTSGAAARLRGGKDFTRREFPRPAPYLRLDAGDARRADACHCPAAGPRRYPHDRAALCLPVPVLCGRFHPSELPDARHRRRKQRRTPATAPVARGQEWRVGPGKSPRAFHRSGLDTLASSGRAPERRLPHSVTCSVPPVAG
jgi:hypothetical protein